MIVYGRKRLVKVERKKCRLGMGIMLKTTSLEREVSLLVQMRIM
jgi:hypothetical protein